MWITSADEEGRAKAAVIGSTVAAKLFEGQSPVGKQLRIGATVFTVVGVLEPKGSSGMGDDQDDVVFVPLSTAMARLQKTKHLQSIEMSVAREDQMDAAQAEVTAVLRESHRLSPSDENDFDVMNQAEIIKNGFGERLDAHDPSGGYRGSVAHRRRHRHHEHHARLGD